MEYDVAAETLAARLGTEAGAAVRLIQIGRGVFDSMPVSLVSTATESQLTQRFDSTLDRRRFRANFICCRGGRQ